MNRREVLKLLSYGGAGLGAAGALGLWKIQPGRVGVAPRAQDNERRPERAPVEKRVVVIGGGLAGLSAAIELQQRGMRVHLVEQAAQLGGKLTGWKDRVLGEDVPLEHGFHGFFSQYYNLDALLTAAGAKSDLIEVDRYPVLFNGREPEFYRSASRLFPLNLLSVVRESKSLHLRDFFADGEGMLELMRYHPRRSFERFDTIDFATFYKEGRINRAMVDTVLVPFGRTTLNRLERLSAAEALRFFHFYFLGNPEGLGYRVLGRDSMSAVVEPLGRYFEQLGGTLHLGRPVKQLHVQDAQVRGVRIDTALDTAGLQTPVASVPIRGWRRVETPDGGAVFIGRRQEGFVALSSRCSHMGCSVQALPEGGFLCPCHAGRYDDAGKVIAGPPPRGLSELPAQRRGDAVVISAPEASGETLKCDYAIVACEVRGLQRLVAGSQLAAPDLVQRVAALGEADPYIVWRLWLDRPTQPGREPFYTVTGYRYTDSLARYSQFQEPYRAWAARTGGAVVEVHAYAIAPEQLGPDAGIRAAMLEELWQLLPELRGARVLHDTFMRQDNFSRFAPGAHARRPTTRTEITNLFLAGDHVRLEQAAFLMEAAAMSGRLAANEVLFAEGVQEAPVWAVRSGCASC